MFNEQSLKDRLKNKSKETGISLNNLLSMYVYECFLKRISKSDKRDNFILKGGILICRFYGLNNRVTTDIDFSLTNKTLEKNAIKQIIKDIIDIDLKDGISFSLLKIESIMNQDHYDGLRVKIAYKFDKMKNSISIDIATGDVITPNPIKYTYESILDDDSFNILIYNPETIIAEKLESILELGTSNGRMKDFYDLYITSKYRKKVKIDEETLKLAIANTFCTRNYKYDGKIFELIKDSEKLQQLWKSYITNNEFAHNITYNDVIKEIEHYIKLIK